MNFIYLILGIIIGILLGIFLTSMIMVRWIFGTLKMMHDGDESYLFLDLDRYPKELSKYKYVIFKVDKNINSQE